MVLLALFALFALYGVAAIFGLFMRSPEVETRVTNAPVEFGQKTHIPAELPYLARRCGFDSVLACHS
jgi:hypothetical protein